jgi:hypothetical protein
MESSKKLLESLNNLWHRVRDQPKAWLADKVQSFNVSQNSTNESWPKPTTQDMEEGFMPWVETSSNADNLPTKPAETFTALLEVLAAEEESRARTLGLRNATVGRKQLGERMEKMETELVRMVEAVYEDEYGLITTNHRQIKGLVRID